MWSSKSVSQAHTELGFETGQPASLWLTLVAAESRLVLLFKCPHAPHPRLFLPGLGLSSTICEMGTLRDGMGTVSSSRRLSLQLCQALPSTPSKYLLADHSSRWRPSAWARIPALLLPGSLTLGERFYLSEPPCPKLENRHKNQEPDLLRPQFCCEKNAITRRKRVGMLTPYYDVH